MNYREITPIPILQPFIKCFWVLEGTNPSPEPERIFPDGCMELIFHKTQYYIRLNENESYIQPSAFIMGQITKAVFFLPSTHTSIIGVRFQPFGLSAFSNLLPQEFINKELLITEIWGANGADLEEQVNLNAIPQAITILQQFFLKQLQQAKFSYSYHAISTISKAIQKAGGENTVNYWAEKANLSERQFNRSFKNTIGISPKEYLKITRFNKVLRVFENEKTTSFSALAQQCGYYDQAHFIKDFKEYTGTTPKGYAQDDTVLMPIYSD